ncbi:DUF3883 domain-containing protein [Fibrobacter sp. UWB12]|uniref:DUF3883 domain-containing protein n=1 Tax=Fibrobacter sp. UWB12 TaxID=1896203 RepID=UPI000917D94C|nr:DUF3883 domain-containing protein [Fibrobacter sp. UWB12]SHK90804.1 protein of unknown function [Fibrobacter sp. UWB12]
MKESNKRIRMIAEELADQMIEVAVKYANKWGRTSGVGFVTIFSPKWTGITVMDRNQLVKHLEKQKSNLIKIIENGGFVEKGVVEGPIKKGTKFDLTKGFPEKVVFDIYLRNLVRLGIAVSRKDGEKVLLDVFNKIMYFRTGGGDLVSKENGGISSKISAIARFTPTNLKPAFHDGITGWENIFKKLDKAAKLTEKYELNDEDENENLDATAYVPVLPPKKYTPPETEMKKEIEDTAVKIASEYYEEKGFSVKSVEKENCGWDLTVIKGDKERHIEVKGTSRNDYHFFLSKNEYEKMISDPKWRLFVVKNVLEDPEPDCIVIRRQNVEKLFDLIPFCFEGTWKE